MKTAENFSIVLLVTIAVTLIATGCDSATVLEAERGNPSPSPVHQEVTIHFEEEILNQWMAKGSFRLSGAITDEGYVETSLNVRGDEARSTVVGTKMLHGENGTLRLIFVGASDGDSRTEGTFEIAEGSGSYADLSLSGRFEMNTNRTSSPNKMESVYSGRIN